MTSLPASLSTVATTIEMTLDEHGPMTERQLVRALESSGLNLGADAGAVFAEVEDAAAAPLVVMPDHRTYAFLPRMYRGRVFTHRLTEVEAHRDVLAVDPDLTAPLMIADDDERFARLDDGSDLLFAEPGYTDAPLRDRGLDPGALTAGRYVVLPPGLLTRSGARAGDLVAVVLTEKGWSIGPTDAKPSDPERLRANVRGWFSGEREPQHLPPMVWRLCATTDAFTQAELPMTELLQAWGLHGDDDLVARDSFDFARWRLEERIGRIAADHRLDDDAALAVAVLSAHYRSLEQLLESVTDLDDEELAGAFADDVSPAATGSSDDDDDDSGTGLADVLGELAASLPEPGVAEALLEETTRDAGGGAALGLFVESLQAIAPASAQPVVGWLQAKAHELSGAITEAEVALRDAVGGGDFPPALRDLARYAADRGNAAEALDLLRRSGAGKHDPQVELLTTMSTTAASDLGRNKPCWCGSGRKYKVCHLGKETLPLEERAVWLYQKAGAHAEQGPWGANMVELALERARFARDDETLEHVLTDGLIVDVALFEGGVLEDFLDQRGALLPEDERLLATQWLLHERSVFEVEAVRPGASLTLRDVRTGDVRTVRERTASRTLTPGTVLCTRALPAGDTWQLFGGIEPVSLQEREALIALLDSEPDAYEVVAALSRRYAPPTLFNTEGEALVLREVVVRPTEPTALAAWLDSAYERAEDATTWHERAPGADQIRTFLRQTGDTITVSTNSDERADRVLAALREADPGLEVTADERRTGAEIHELAERFPDLAAPATGAQAVDVPDEAVAAAVADLMRQYEDAWLDESVPALDGLTPRQAVMDPTRRDDVIRLLRSWPAPTPQSMNRDRIAAALGLDLA